MPRGASSGDSEIPLTELITNDDDSPKSIEPYQQQQEGDSSEKNTKTTNGKSRCTNTGGLAGKAACKVQTLMQKYQFVRAMDLFGYAPAITHNVYNDRFSSYRGIVASLFVIIGVLIAFGLRLAEFADPTPSVSMREVHPDQEAEVPLVPTAFVFRAFDSNFSPTIPFYNISYFRVLMGFERVFEQDLKPRERFYAPAVPCDVSDWAGHLGKQALCPAPNVSLRMRGRYSQKLYTFSHIEVTLCDAASPLLHWPGNGSAVQCAPLQEIERFLNYGRFYLMQRYSSGGDPSLPATTLETFQYEMPPEKVSLGIEYELQQKFITITPNLAWQFSATKFVTMQPHTEKSHVRTQWAVPPQYGGGMARLGVFLHFSRTAVEEKRVIETIWQFMGGIYALLGAVTTVLGIYFLKHNENAFYETAGRGWWARDENFELDKTKPVEKNNIFNELCPNLKFKIL